MKINLFPFLATAQAARSNQIVGVGFSGIQLMNTKDVVDTCKPVFGRNVNKSIYIQGYAFGIPVYSYSFKPVSQDVEAPAECYKIHLCTPDLDGESI